MIEIRNAPKDETAKMTCEDSPDPEPEHCVSGSECEGCDVSVQYEGVTYCCNSNCDMGWINVDPGTDPLCQCGHE